MKCFKTILRCTRLMEEAHDRICLLIIGPTEPFSTKIGSQIARKMPHFGYPLSSENTYIMGCWTAMKDIHCLWSVSKPSLDASSTGEELSCPSSRHMWVSPRYVPRRLTLELPTKCKFWVYPLSMIIGCWTVRRDIHSIWIGLIPVLDAEWRWEKLLTVSGSHSWVSQCNYPPQLTVKLPIKYQVFNTLSVQ